MKVANSVVFGSLSQEPARRLAGGWLVKILGVHTCTGVSSPDGHGLQRRWLRAG